MAILRIHSENGLHILGEGYMKRLTFDGNFCDIAQCVAIPCPCNNACTQKQVWERLKMYEDRIPVEKLERASELLKEVKKDD